MNDKGIVLLSGGLDSALLCAFLQRAEKDDVLPLFVNRKQRALEAERSAANAVVDLLGIKNGLIEVEVGLDAYRPMIGEAERNSLGIPARNLVLLALAAPYAYLQKASYVAIAANASDDFPDCSPEFLSKFSEILNIGLKKDIQVRAPFAESGMKKNDVIDYGFKQGLQNVMWHTLSCYFPAGDLHCGECRGCVVRKEAFEVARLKDETRYKSAD